MKALKIIVYLALLVLAVFFFRKFRAEYTRVGWAADQRIEAIDPKETNDVAVAAAESATNVVELDKVTNAVPSQTNLASAVASASNAVPGVAASGGVPPRKPSWGGYLGAFIVTLVGLAGLGGWEFSKWIASRAHSAIFDESAEVVRDPEYDEAEDAWANGRYLDAVTLLREYLQKNPSEVHASLRIAEIYEKNLRNHLAAAMELEEVLGKKLPRDRWGWTAIHLANLYSGPLNQPEKALALLHRIIDEYPETAAAEKARTRLGVPGPEEGAAAQPEAGYASAAPEESPSNLPRGFRPKK